MSKSKYDKSIQEFKLRSEIMSESARLKMLLDKLDKLDPKAAEDMVIRVKERITLD